MNKIFVVYVKKNFVRMINKVIKSETIVIILEV